MKIDDLHKGILKLFEEETNRIVAEEAKRAGERVEERVRGLAGSIATRVASVVSCHRLREELIITVKLQEQQS